MRYAIITNPASGRMTVDRKRSELAKAAQILDAQIHGLDTGSAQELAQCAQGLAARYDILVAAGGDGTFSDIINAVGEGLDATRCGGTSDCQHGEICLTHELWTDLSHQIDLFLSQITLASLVTRRQDADNLIDARIL